MSNGEIFYTKKLKENGNTVHIVTTEFGKYKITIKKGGIKTINFFKNGDCVSSATVNSKDPVKSIIRDIDLGMFRL